jgi:hypothetical protein
MSVDSISGQRSRDEQPRSMMTRAQFCEKAGISLSTYHYLKRNGKGPEEINYEGTAVYRISIKAYHAWELKMESWSKTDASKLENQRRLERAKAAGTKAAESHLHVSKRGKTKPKKSVKA